MNKSSVVMFCRRYVSSFLLYFIGVLSGITLYSVFTANRIIHQRTHASDLFKSPSSEARSGRSSPVVFVGGHPRSGTTLMRVLLDAHPSFHCGQETHVIPELLTMRSKYSRGRAWNRSKEAGIDLRLINTTIADAILNIIRNRRGALNSHHERLCAKDPFTLKHIPYLSFVFPTAQFILMVRDGRAVVHSIRKNNLKIAHFPKTDEEGLQRWNKAVGIMLNGCLEAGSERCIVVHYESLVLEPRFWLQKILRFLRVPWSESVLKHTQTFGISGGIFLSRLEKSTNQVRKPIYNDSLYSWLSTPLNLIPRKELISLAPMMNTLGYTEAGQPNYTKLKEKKFMFKT